MAKKKKKISSEEYARRKRELLSYLKFGFNTRTKFTPQQKAAITRQWNKYRWLIEAEEKGEAYFTKTTKAKNLPNIKKTNKGLFIIEKNVDRVQVTGKGKKTRIHIKRGKFSEIYVPKPPGEDIVSFADRMLEEYQPRYISLGVNGYKGRTAYDPKQWHLYNSTLTKIIFDIEQQGEADPQEIFGGVYLIWGDLIPTRSKHRKRQRRRKWENFK